SALRRWAAARQRRLPRSRSPASRTLISTSRTSISATRALSTNPRTTMTADWLPRRAQAHRAVVLASLGVVVALAWTYPLLGSGTEDGDDGIPPTADDFRTSQG